MLTKIELNKLYVNCAVTGIPVGFSFFYEAPENKGTEEPFMEVRVQHQKNGEPIAFFNSRSQKTLDDFVTWLDLREVTPEEYQAWADQYNEGDITWDLEKILQRFEKIRYGRGKGKPIMLNPEQTKKYFEYQVKNLPKEEWSYWVPRYAQRHGINLSSFKASNSLEG